MNMPPEIIIRDHTRLQGEKAIDIVHGNILLATVYPRTNEIAITSKYMTDYELDGQYPPKITLSLENGEINRFYYNKPFIAVTSRSQPGPILPCQPTGGAPAVN